MSKGSIKNPSIAIRPSTKLHDYVKTLTDPDLELPVNILKLHVALTGDQSDRKTTTSEVPIAALTKRDEELLAKLSTDDKVCDSVQACLQQLSIAFETEEATDGGEIVDVNDGALENLSKAEAKRLRAKARDQELVRITLNLNDLKWLNLFLAKQRDSGNAAEYFHELLEGSQLILPINEVIARNPELEARCKRLRREQEDRAYQAMTKNVDNNRRHAPDDTIGYQIKQINRQLIGVVQFVVSVAAGFAFGFIGVELIIGEMDFGARLMLGIFCALVIAVAEIYFLAKKLNEDLDFAEQQQKLLQANKIGFSPPSSDSATKQHSD